MRQFLFPILAIWAIIASPGLCVAGVLEHLCAGCPETVSCEHEDDCATDPCVDMVARPTTGAELGLVGPIAVLVAVYTTVEFDQSRHDSAALEPFPPERKNLTRPESDLPLLN